MTDFKNQVVVDLENPRTVVFSNLNGKSYAKSFQMELNFNILTHLDIRTAYKYLNVKTDYQTGLLENRCKLNIDFLLMLLMKLILKIKVSSGNLMLLSIGLEHKDCQTRFQIQLFTN